MARFEDWFLLFCVGSCAFVYKAESCPEEWETKHTGFCYKLVKAPMNFTDADGNCKSHGAELASIMDMAEGDVVNSMLFYDNKRHDGWIGLMCTKVDECTDKQNWEWTDGHTIVNPNWNGMEPDIDTQMCGRIIEGEWRNSNCNNEYPSVCKKSNSTDNDSGESNEEDSEESEGLSTKMPATSASVSSIKTTAPSSTSPTTPTPAPASSTPGNQQPTVDDGKPDNGNIVGKQTTEPSSQPSSTVQAYQSGQDDDDEPTEVYMYVAAALGAVLFIVLIFIIVAVILFYRRKKKKEQESNRSNPPSGIQVDQASGFASTMVTTVDGSVYSYLDDAVTDDVKAQKGDASSQYNTTFPRGGSHEYYGVSIAPYSTIGRVNSEKMDMKPEPPRPRQDPTPSKISSSQMNAPVYAVPMKKKKAKDLFAEDEEASVIVDNQIYGS